MGYYTKYEITTIAGPHGSVERFEAQINRDCAGGLPGTMKWYEHDRDITNAMLLSGVEKVDLHGKGEEHDDVWDKEYRQVDGKVTVKKFRYDLVRRSTPE